DRIAASLGIARNAPQRLEAGTLHVLGEAADRGHLFLPRTRLIEDADRLLGGAGPTAVGAAIDALDAAGAVELEPLPAAGAAGAAGGVGREPLPGGGAGGGAGSPAETGGQGGPADQAVFVKALHTAETGIAARVKALLAQPPLPLDIDLGRALEWFERGEKI